MGTILKFKSFQDFLTHNNDTILNNYYSHYYFLRCLDKLNSKQMDLFDSYNVIDDFGNSVFCVWVSGSYYFYGDRWSDDLIDTLLEYGDFKQFKRFSFLGQRDLVIDVLTKANIKFNVVKDRLVYKCTRTLPSKKKIPGKVLNAALVDFEELVQLSHQYYTEEYQGQGQKTIEEIRASVFQSIQNGNLFNLIIKDKICSILQIISNYRNKPMIGGLFTKPEFRNRGYAYKLLLTITRHLTRIGYDECGLVSDVTNPASNKVFVNTGYSPIYKFIVAHN